MELALIEMPNHLALVVFKRAFAAAFQKFVLAVMHMLQISGSVNVSNPSSLILTAFFALSVTLRKSSAACVGEYHCISRKTQTRPML